MLRLTFESNELVSAPTVTVGAATATVSPTHRAGVAARGFGHPAAPATYAATWVAEVTVTDAFTPASGDIGWAATGHEGEHSPDTVSGDVARLCHTPQFWVGVHLAL